MLGYSIQKILIVASFMVSFLYPGTPSCFDFYPRCDTLNSALHEGDSLIVHELMEINGLNPDSMRLSMGCKSDSNSQARVVELCFSDLRLTELPESIGNLDSMKILSVTNNLLTDLPLSITGLPVGLITGREGNFCAYPLARVNGNMLCNINPAVIDWLDTAYYFSYQYNMSSAFCDSLYDSTWTTSQNCDTPVRRHIRQSKGDFDFLIVPGGGRIPLEGGLLEGSQTFDIRGKRLNLEEPLQK